MSPNQLEALLTGEGPHRPLPEELAGWCRGRPPSPPTGPACWDPGGSCPGSTPTWLAVPSEGAEPVET